MADNQPPRLQLTDPPGKFIIIYDGACGFCTARSKQLSRLAPGGKAERRSYHDEGALADLPGLSPDLCRGAVRVVTPQGVVFGGAEAVAQLVAGRKGLGQFAYTYYLPGIRQVCDTAYSIVARNRHRISRWTGSKVSCQTGSGAADGEQTARCSLPG